MLLELNGEEHDVLADVLARALRELRGEIYRTEAADFHAQLKRREAVLDVILQRLAANESSAQ